MVVYIYIYIYIYIYLYLYFKLFINHYRTTYVYMCSKSLFGYLSIVGMVTYSNPDVNLKEIYI